MILAIANRKEEMIFLIAIFISIPPLILYFVLYALPAEWFPAFEYHDLR
jgi:hypothetical protein